MTNFTISFFELMFLAEAVIPKQSIERSMCFNDFSEIHYHKMFKNQRQQFFEHVTNCKGFSLENEQCRHFHARFNPDNQYLVTFNRKKERCYLFDGNYHVSINKFINPNAIKKVEKICTLL